MNFLIVARYGGIFNLYFYSNAVSALQWRYIYTFISITVYFDSLFFESLTWYMETLAFITSLRVYIFCNLHRKKSEYRLDQKFFARVLSFYFSPTQPKNRFCISPLSKSCAEIKVRVPSRFKNICSLSKRENSLWNREIWEHKLQLKHISK